MADNDAEKKRETSSQLSETAESLRRAAKRRVEEERTTLEMADPDAPPDEIGELLVAQGLITRHQLFNALNESYRTGSSLEQAITSLGLVDGETLASLVHAHRSK